MCGTCGGKMREAAGIDHGGGGMGGALLLVGAVALGGYAIWHAIRNRKDSELMKAANIP